jgi:PPOX class probable FMN-dependent enzyme
MPIDSLAALRARYPAPKERALRKQLDRLDRHCCAFIALSPFVVLASHGTDGELDASPRGGEPGFVQVLDARTLLLPDSPGNNRLDTLSNIVATGRLGLLFMVPGVDETLRVNGSATLDDDPALLARFVDRARRPSLVIRIEVAQAYLHCAKALMRSALWDPASRIDRASLPTMGQMIHDQLGDPSPPESQADMLRRYAADL